MNHAATQPAARGDALAPLRALFLRALDVPPAARDAWLAAQVPDAAERAALARLLDADAREGPLDAPVDELAARLADGAIVEHASGRRIGAFRLVRPIGVGGMAAVFLAEREIGEFRQRVAIKLLRHGLATELERRLFLRERRVLAQLEHPNIARLVDGGVSDDGLPYLVMEFVDGRAITRYADDEKLDLRARLALVVTVCRAVDAAHRALVVHRDIKPANILVAADGTVKLVDFGIAKLLSDDADRTATGVFTPNYAAPEQRDGGPITTATDVYALGVLVHELATGTRPDARAASSLAGDLGTVVGKALEADPSRRYASAGAFADDIARWLAGRPVEARAPSRDYRLRKFVARHRLGAALSVVAVFALVAAFGAALWQAARANAQAQRANELRRFTFAAFAQAAPGTRDGPPTIVDVVTHAVANARADRLLSDATRTELLTEFGGILRDQGDLAGARTLLEQNYAQARTALGNAAPLTLLAGAQLGLVQGIANDFAQARPLLAELLRITPAGDTASLARLNFATAYVTYLAKDHTAATQYAAQARRYAQATGDEAQIDDAISVSSPVAFGAGDYAAALTYANENLERRIRRYGADHAEVAVGHSNLAQYYANDGNLADAERHARRGLEIARATLPADHVSLAFHLNAMTRVLFDRRNYAAAFDTEREALHINRKALPPGHFDITTNLAVVGKIASIREDWPASVDALREASASCDAKFGAGAMPCPFVHGDYGYALAQSGDADGGEAVLRESIARLAALDPPNADEHARGWDRLARVQLDLGKPSAALESAAKIQALVASLDAPGKFWPGRADVLRGRALLNLDRATDAAAALDAALAALDAAAKPDPELAVEAPLYRALAAQRLGDAVAAQTHAERGIASLATLVSAPRRIAQLGDEIRKR